MIIGTRFSAGIVGTASLILLIKRGCRITWVGRAGIRWGNRGSTRNRHSATERHTGCSTSRSIRGSISSIASLRIRPIVVAIKIVAVSSGFLLLLLVKIREDKEHNLANTTS